MITLEPVGHVVGGRRDADDDHWCQVEAVISLDSERFEDDAVAGLEAFSHLVVVFQFHLVDESAVQTGARRPRGTPDWPEVACSPNGPRCDPTGWACRPADCSASRGLDLRVRGLDAVDGTPVLDVKPSLREFDLQLLEVRQPAWATELMAEYW